MEEIMDKVKKSDDNAGKVMLKTLPHSKDLKWPMQWWTAMEKIYRILP